LITSQAYALAKKWNQARNDASIKFGPDDIEGFSSNQIGMPGSIAIVNTSRNRVVQPTDRSGVLLLGSIIFHMQLAQ
jgi:hypothetical protein